MPKSSRPPADLFHPNGRLCLDFFVERIHPALHAAIEMSKQTQWESVRSPHLFMGLLKKPDADVRKWSAHAELNPQVLLDTLQEMFHEPAGNPKALLALHREFLSDNCIRFLRSAYRRAVGCSRKKITALDLLVCLLTESDSIIIECLNLLDHEPNRLAEAALDLER